jgi:hypothetical protein
MCDNPKDDPNRLAAVHWFPRNVPAPQSVFRDILREMCDKHSCGNFNYYASTARIYRIVELHGNEPGNILRLVDEWERDWGRDGPIHKPVAIVFTTTPHLLHWANALAPRGDVISRGRLELHEHVKRMDAYLKCRLAEIEAVHEFPLAEEASNAE